MFDLERVALSSSSKLVLHRQCFSCFSCDRKFDPTLSDATEAPDGGVYCRKCLGERWGEGNRPAQEVATTAAIGANAGDGKTVVNESSGNLTVLEKQVYNRS